MVPDIADILQKGFQEGKTTAKLQFPPKYVDWLVSQDNVYYIVVGKDLQERGSVVVLDSDLFDTIIPKIINKIKNFYSEHKDNIEIIVFSNYLINQSSYNKKGRRTHTQLKEHLCVIEHRTIEQ